MQNFSDISRSLEVTLERVAGTVKSCLASDITSNRPSYRILIHNSLRAVLSVKHLILLNMRAGKFIFACKPIELLGIVLRRLPWVWFMLENFQKPEKEFFGKIFRLLWLTLSWLPAKIKTSHRCCVSSHNKGTPATVKTTSKPNVSLIFSQKVFLWFRTPSEWRKKKVSPNVRGKQWTSDYDDVDALVAVVCARNHRNLL